MFWIMQLWVGGYKIEYLDLNELEACLKKDFLCKNVYIVLALALTNVRDKLWRLGLCRMLTL